MNSLDQILDAMGDARAARQAFYSEQAEALAGKPILLIDTKPDPLFVDSTDLLIKTLQGKIGQEFNLAMDEKGYGKLFRTWLGGREEGQRPNIQTWKAAQGEPCEAVAHFKPDLVVVTGSPEMVTDNKPWMLDLQSAMAHFEQTDTPRVLVCFGHQMNAHRKDPGSVGYMSYPKEGGETVRVREFGSVELRLEPGAENHWFVSAMLRHDSRRGSPWVVAASHGQDVQRLTTGMVCLGGNMVSRYSLVGSNGRSISTQHHPEIPPEVLMLLAHIRKEPIEREMATAPQEVLERNFGGARNHEELLEKINGLHERQTETSIAFFTAVREMALGQIPSQS